MKRNVTLLILIIALTAFAGRAQEARIKGNIRDKDGQPVEWGTVSISKLNIKTKADSSGYYELKNVPYGNHQLVISYIGYDTKFKQVKVEEDRPSLVVDIELSPSTNTLNSVVITGTRTSRRRLESPVAVNILDSRTFSNTQSNTLADGLCFQPGLRMEVDCQTCNYSQLRMNGLGGSYSQVLINSRPVFSSLMSLYGLEQIPSNMIDRVEIVRGGGSVLYGSSAIAGTVNILTKEPKSSSFTLSSNSSFVGSSTWDHFFNANVTTVNESKNAGVSFFGSRRDRNSYDANGDGYSELPMLKNNSFGFNSFFKLSPKDKLEINGWSIYEERKGGNKLELPADKADQSEYRLHNILVGGFNYEHQSNEQSSFSIYGSAQNTKRTHYTGIDQIDAWGHTKNYSMQGGVQYNYTSNDFFGGKNTFTTGFENQYEYTFDEIKAYDYLIDQNVNLFGVFLQSDWEVTNKFTVLSGLRLNKSNRISKVVLTPRLSTLYRLNEETQIRASYARGFKAPQALETDMHMAFAGGGVSVIKTDADLMEETSNSFNASLDFNRASEHFIYGFTLDGFFTRLYNTFVLEDLGIDQSGNKQLLRKNGGNSTVKGITLEGRLNYDQKVQLETGVTFQKSAYENPVFWSADLPGSTKYLRSPDLYGYYTLSFFPQSRFNAILSGVLTGAMEVPHVAGAPGVDHDILYTSPVFLENNLKLSYRFTLKSIKQDLQFNIGVQNMFNQYQKDFDIGKNRDSNYIYGPGRPRTFFMGLKFGLM